jgi:hypothetical protein
MTDTSRNQKQHSEHSTQIFLRGNPMREKTTRTSSLCSSASTNLQVINFQLNRHPPVADNEDTNPLRHQPVTDNEDTNPLRHQPVTKMRTPILSELRLTLAPPCHPKLRKICYITKSFNTS